MSRPDCDLFVGQAKAPVNTATSHTYGVVTVVLVVERTSGRVAAADVVMQSHIMCEFLVDLLVGRQLPNDLPAIVREIEERFHSSSQRAVIQALHDAVHKHSLAAAPLVSSRRSSTARERLRYAVFEWGDSAYLRYGVEGATRTAAKLGASIDIFDCGFDSATQARQIEDAMGSGRYNSFLVCPFDAAAVTPLIRDAIKSNEFLVAVFNGPLGGREMLSGDGLCEPGSVTFVGGQTHEIYVEWLERALELAHDAYPDGGAAAAITGPKVGANSKNMDDAMARVLPGSGIYLVANEETNYTAREGYEKTRAILAENPEVRYIFSNYSGMTQGAVRAVREAGLRNQVRISDFGGSRWALNAVINGDVDITAMMLPYAETQSAVQAVSDHARGKNVPGFIDLTKHPSLPGTAFVTRANVSAFSSYFD